jgi:hypothetical protein
MSGSARTAGADGRRWEPHLTSMVSVMQRLMSMALAGQAPISTAPIRPDLTSMPPPRPRRPAAMWTTALLKPAVGAQPVSGRSSGLAPGPAP